MRLKYEREVKSNGPCLSLTGLEEEESRGCRVGWLVTLVVVASLERVYEERLFVVLLDGGKKECLCRRGPRRSGETEWWRWTWLLKTWMRQD